MTENLLEVKNLSVCFKNGNEVFTAAKDVSFVLKSKEVLGIVGESGSGKSVTALSILGLLPYPKAFHNKEASVMLNGEELIGADAATLRTVRGGRIGFVFQEPMSSLNPLHRIGDQIAETICFHQKLSLKKARNKTLRLLKTVGIKNPARRYRAFPFELSGGQRQRVMIAMAIANNPEILIADEPTTALDVTIQEQIITLLAELKKQLDMSIIFISHDLHLIRRIADRILVMYQGKIIEQGAVESIFTHPSKNYTKSLIKSYFPLKKCHKSNDDVLVSAQDVTVSYPLKKTFLGRVTQNIYAVNHASFNIYRGQTLGVVGESGSGKTTLGMALANLIKYEGRFVWRKAYNHKDFRQNVQIVFQDPYNSLNPRLNVLQIVGEGLWVHFPNLKNDEVKTKVAEMLNEVGLSATDLYKYPHEFSGGQRQRIAIARALILDPEVVVLDEPTSALDVTVQAQILELLKNLQQKSGMAYVFISHDMRAVKAIADSIVVMKDGKIVENNRAEEIFEHPREVYTQALIKASLTQEGFDKTV